MKLSGRQIYQRKSFVIEKSCRVCFRIECKVKTKLN